MTCLENFPNDLEPTIACGTEIIEFGIVPDKSNKINSKEFIL